MVDLPFSDLVPCFEFFVGIFDTHAVDFMLFRQQAPTPCRKLYNCPPENKCMSPDCKPVKLFPGDAHSLELENRAEMLVYCTSSTEEDMDTKSSVYSVESSAYCSGHALNTVRSTPVHFPDRDEGS